MAVKRTGIAVTDPLQIIATALETVPNSWITRLFEKIRKRLNPWRPLL